MSFVNCQSCWTPMVIHHATPFVDVELREIWPPPHAHYLLLYKYKCHKCGFILYALEEQIDDKDYAESRLASAKAWLQKGGE